MTTARHLELAERAALLAAMDRACLAPLVVAPCGVCPGCCETEDDYTAGETGEEDG